MHVTIYPSMGDYKKNLEEVTKVISIILLVFSFVLCIICAFWYPGAPAPGWSRPHLGWLGMALYFLSLILSGVHGLR
jgi:hypothetical protein